MDGGNLLDQKQLRTNWTTSHLMGVIILDYFLNLMDTSVVNLHAIYKVLYSKGMENFISNFTRFQNCSG